MPFNASLSGLRVASAGLDVISSNIANGSTTGYKQSTTEFRDVCAGGGSTAAIGSGVNLTSVAQQFTPGNIDAAATSLQLAINGTGFFVLQATDGSRIYSRNGNFFADKDGNISNSLQQKLIGFLTDANNKITGAYGPLVIQNNSIAPTKTANVDVTVNLPSNTTPPASPFITGFTKANPPSSTTYNYASSVQIYDSLGNDHLMTMYYVKSHALSTWNVYVGIDDVDVTQTAAIPPGGTPAVPGIYPAGQLPRPYTIVFDSTGNYVVHNPASLPTYSGAPPVLSTVTPTILTTAGTLAPLSINDLTINGVAISLGTTTDAVSTTDPRASAISILNAINAHTALHGVTASTTGTTVQFTGGTYASDALAAGDLTINGVPIIGNPGLTPATLATLINATGGSGVPGVVASTYTDGLGATQLQLVAVDGRNIQVATGGTAANLNFTNFATAGGAALNEVVRGQVSLTIPDNQGITIGGNNPTRAGLTAGTRAGIFQTSSDPIDFFFDPGLGAQPHQAIAIKLNKSTQQSNAFSTTALTQDGYSTGNLTGFEVDANGIITARFGNGKSQQLGQVALANFPNPQALQSVGNTSWIETSTSGVALLGAPGTANLGLIQSTALEASNVILTDELVALILTQRNFQANAQAIKTSDAITQTIINIR